jgi:16S rRNA (guanine1516-N2)-methyltransferase
MTIRGDLARLLPRLKPGRLQRELLVRAARIKDPRTPGRPTAVDATAGLGEDSLLLAAAGFDVLMFERNEIIAALLMDSLKRAADIPELSGVVGRMRAIHADSIQALGSLDFLPDVVLLDPMFPAKHNDAAAKKKLQLLQQLEQPCEDEAALLDAALSAHPLKIVVKRPVKGPFLADRKPDYSLSGKAIRYDCFALPR